MRSIRLLAKKVPTLVDDLLFHVLDLAIDKVQNVFGEHILDQIFHRDLVVEDRADQLGIEDVHRQLDVGNALGLVVAVLEGTFYDRVSVLSADKGADIGFLPQQTVGQGLQVVHTALDMSVEVTVHVDDRFLDLTGVELVHTADLIEQGGDLLGSVAGQGLHLFLVYEVPDLLHHLVFSRYRVAVEHILVVLVVVVVDLLLQTTHYIQSLEDLGGQFGGYMVHDLVDFFAEEQINLRLLIAKLLGQGVTRPYGAWFLRMKNIRAFG